MLQQVQIKYSKLSILKQYLLQIPVCPYSQALKMAHLTVRYLKIETYIIKLRHLILAFIVIQNLMRKIKSNMSIHLTRLKCVMTMRIKC